MLPGARIVAELHAEHSRVAVRSGPGERAHRVLVLGRQQHVAVAAAVGNRVGLVLDREVRESGGGRMLGIDLHVVRTLPGVVDLDPPVGHADHIRPEAADSPVEQGMVHDENRHPRVKHPLQALHRLLVRLLPQHRVEQRHVVTVAHVLIVRRRLGDPVVAANVGPADSQAVVHERVVASAEQPLIEVMHVGVDAVQSVEEVDKGPDMEEVPAGQHRD